MTSLTRFLVLSFICGLFSLTVGCKVIPKDPDLIQSSYQATDELLERCPVLVPEDGAVFAATLVSVDDLEKTSSLGRVIAEQISSRLSQRGFAVTELKLRKNVFVKAQGGEFMLSREIQNIADLHDIHAVVVGTYGIGSDRIFVSLRLVSPGNSSVMATHDYTLPLGRNMRKLIGIRSSNSIYYLPGTPGLAYAD